MRGNRRKPVRQRGTRCNLMPGERFPTLDDAKRAQFDRQLNTALGGMGQARYRVEKCKCTGYHLVLNEHFQEWRNARGQR